ncbi:MAG: hypothetical protein QME96_17040 [Myxococcota bacterium]|nr:hypothetical protein [Myxococcota bacterium]
MTGRRVGRRKSDAVVADLHRIRRAMFKESDGDIAKFVEMVRAEARRSRRSRSRPTQRSRTAAAS